MHRMPPLNALRAFEAAARHLSLTKAARELNVSPGAVSHQLRGLEKLLGVKLFERGVRTITLTRLARRFILEFSGVFLTFWMRWRTSHTPVSSAFSS